MFTNLLFDLDGTLVDPKQGITRSIQYSLARLGRPSFSEFELQKYIGPPLRSTFKELLLSKDEFLVEEAVKLYRERFSKIGIFENVIYPGINELLCALNEKSFRMYVVTSKPKTYADRIIEHFQLNRFFLDVYGSELDGSYDNKVELVELILRQLNLNSKETVIVGDRKVDISAGRLNHIKTIGVTYGYGSKQEIAESAPDYICKDPDEILNTILSLA